jgi:long-subunit fatty acid transport protein
MKLFFVLALVILTNAELGSAQGFYGSFVSADANRRAGIFSSSAIDATDSLVLNPAGLSDLKATSVEFSILGEFARGSFSNASNNASPMSSNYGFVPFGSIGAPLGKHWAVGFGIMPDLLSTSKWHYSDTPGYGGVDYGLQREKSQIDAIRGMAGVAYRFSDKLSIGATVGSDFNSNTLDAPYIFQIHPVLAGLKTLLDLHTSGFGWNSSYGINAKPTRRLDLGASFRTATSITSHGSATGNLGVAFQTLGIPFPPAFAYRGQVHVQLPPSALVSAGWQATPTVRLSFQSDWIGWRNSFNTLPVTLTQGNNPDINGLLKSNGIKDTVPLDWKDQFNFRGALERSLGENLVIGAGYLHGNNPVPRSTLSPLTAAIMQDGLTTGLSWHTGRVHFGASYGYGFTAQGQVAHSSLLYDEYSNAKTKIGTQSFTLTTGFTL